MKSSEIQKIKNQFLSNRKAIERLKQRIEIIETEDRAMMKLISEVEEAPDNLLQIRIQKAIAKKNSKIKVI